jgi:hypothetical protein
LFFVWFVEVCPLQDVKKMDINSKEMVGFFSLQLVTCLNIFDGGLYCFWFAGGR